MNQGTCQQPASADEDCAPDPNPKPTAAWRRWLRRNLHVLAIGALLLLGGAVVLADRIFIVIPAGHVGALWNRFSGTRVDRVFDEGLHVISPLDIMTPYEVRKQLAVHTLDVLSAEGLTVALELAIRFQPEYDLVGLLHETIGPDYMVRVVIPQSESVLRKQLGNASAVQIYTNEDGLLMRALLMAMNEAGRNLVEIDDIVILTITLPERVKTAINDKITQGQLLSSYLYRRETAVKEADRKRIEAAGIRDYQAIIDETLSERFLVYQGIQATRDLATSDNPKTLVVGAGSNSLALPIFLGDMTKGHDGTQGNSAPASAYQPKALDADTPEGLEAGARQSLADPTLMLTPRTEITK
ncbi:MAG: prohibitin family protein [Thiohalocapsa sp.]